MTDVTVAVLDTTCDAVGVTTMLTATEAPLASVDRLQVTVPETFAQLALLTLTNDTPAGSVSTSDTTVAALGP